MSIDSGACESLDAVDDDEGVGLWEKKNFKVSKLWTVRSHGYILYLFGCHGAFSLFFLSYGHLRRS
jgi:hypothetical protein